MPSQQNVQEWLCMVMYFIIQNYNVSASLYNVLLFYYYKLSILSSELNITRPCPWLIPPLVQGQLELSLAASQP